MGAFTDKHIKANARMLHAVLLKKEFISFLLLRRPREDCMYTCVQRFPALQSGPIVGNLTSFKCAAGARLPQLQTL
jgi:hypothetical protein